MGPKDYWKKVCAPVVAGKKELVGRSLTNTDIAEAVQAMSGKKTKRALVEHWFKGIREPYISQFVALCAKLELDPLEVLRPQQYARKEQLIHHRGNLTERLSIPYKNRQRKTG